MPVIRNLTAAALALFFVAATSEAQPAPTATPHPATGPAAFEIFIKGQQVGREEDNVYQTPEGGWRITSTGEWSNPKFAIKLFEVRYASDWQPIELRLEATTRDKPFSLNTTFGLTTATNEIRQEGTPAQKTDQVSVRTVVVPNNIYGSYEAFAARLAVSEKGAKIPAYVVPQMEIAAIVDDIVPEQIQSPRGTVNVHRYRVSFQNPGLPMVADVWVDDRGRLARLEVPSVTLQVVREELASAMTRFETVTHPGDEPVTIPANGFNLAGTVTRPVGLQQRMRFPAVVLVAGSGPQDRNETVFGIPIFGQIAGALADAGFLVVRYDKRGVGQSGGRAESATISDYADDALAVFKYVSKRPDVVPQRVAMLGHSEGAAVAMIAGAREKKISALILVAGMGVPGADLVLWQQQHVLERSKLPPEERAAKIELQKKIENAVLTGKGWEGIPNDLRKLADTAWFHSVLAFDPAKVMKDVRQPILIVNGTLDTQVPPSNAEKLAQYARERKKNAGVELKLIPGVNHLLVPATTGEYDEYTDLKDKKVSQAVIDAILAWLKSES